MSAGLLVRKYVLNAWASPRLVLYPDDGLCVVIMTNTRPESDGGLDLTRIANGVEDIARSRL